MQGIQLLAQPRLRDAAASSPRCACAQPTRSAPTRVILYGDLLFRSYMLRDLLTLSAPVTVVVDSAPLPEHGNRNDLAWCSAADDRALYRQDVSLEQVSRERRWRERAPDGRWIGMLRARGEGSSWLRDALARARGAGRTSRAWACPIC